MIGFGYPFRGLACRGDSGCGGEIFLKKCYHISEIPRDQCFSKIGRPSMLLLDAQAGAGFGQ